MTPATFPMRSPDGRCEVHFGLEHDDRSGPWGWLRVVQLPSGEPVVQFGTREQPPTVRFEPGGVVHLRTHNGWGMAIDLRIDTVQRRCRLQPDLDDLPADDAVRRLNARRPMAAASATPRRRRWSATVDTFVSLAFTASGAGYALYGSRLMDRVMGGLCALFFALCAWASTREGWGREPPER